MDKLQVLRDWKEGLDDMLKEGLNTFTLVVWYHQCLYMYLKECEELEITPQGEQKASSTHAHRPRGMLIKDFCASLITENSVPIFPNVLLHWLRKDADYFKGAFFQNAKKALVYIDRSKMIEKLSTYPKAADKIKIYLDYMNNHKAESEISG